MSETTSPSVTSTPATTASADRERDGVLIRLVRPDEVDAVSALAVGAYAASYRLSDTYRSDIGAVADRVRQHEVWVAVDAASGALLGTVSTPREGRVMSAVAHEGELDFRLLAVAAEARRRGIGEVLVEHVLGLARARGARRVVLNTGPDMVGAHRLYERLGFERLPEREYTFTRPDGSSFLMMAYGRDAAASAPA
ncbi:GNAT family N-acetyltransferase [Agromyces salentinus]|uniref:N-acetyltransferase domain-containing protein n=1 Tax=Agromyces salentinus TaxID=269421 RepID=A0ABN2MTV7_9MICO|nr:GNAT family N-acetyltransferase [Agromyces salentinus]